MLLIVAVISVHCRKFWAIRTHRPTNRPICQYAEKLYHCAADDDVSLEILVLLFGFLAKW